MRQDRWPPDVSPIGIEDLARLGLNPANQLFWDGRRVEIRSRVNLTRPQKTLAVLVSIFAVLGGIGGFVTGLNNAGVFLCARDVHWLGCPAVVAPAATVK